MNNQLVEIGQTIKSKNKILITAHLLPDGDSVGSVIGLGLALKALGKEVFMVMEDQVPETYSFLEGAQNIITPKELPVQPDLLIFLDCGDISRAGDNWYNLLLKNALVINIDHHISNKYFGALNYVDPQAAATAELVYALLTDMNQPISKEIATALYTGLVMDTGSFQYQNTSAVTLRIAAALLDSGVDLSLIRNYLLENKSIKHLQLVATAIDNLEFTAQGKVAWTYLDQRTMKKYNAVSEHAEGIVTYPISVENVEVGLFFRETKKKEIKVGLRSLTDFDVNKIALFFGGGGHQRAAGCTLSTTLENAIHQVVDKVLSLMTEE